MVQHLALKIGAHRTRLAPARIAPRPILGRSLVRRLTREDLEEIYAARLGLEGLAARVGAPALGDAGHIEMRGLMRELERIAKRRDV